MKRLQWFPNGNSYTRIEWLILRILKYDLQSAQWLRKRDTCIRILDLVRPKKGMVSLGLPDVSTLGEREAEELTACVSEIITPYLSPSNPDLVSCDKGPRSNPDLSKPASEGRSLVPKGGFNSHGQNCVEFQWIWRARIVMDATNVFRDTSETEFLALQHASNWPFRPQDFYRYSRACLRVAQSTGSGKPRRLPPFSRPPMGVSPQEERAWFFEIAADSQRQAISSAIGAKVEQPSEDNAMA